MYSDVTHLLLGPNVGALWELRAPSRGVHARCGTDQDTLVCRLWHRVMSVLQS